VQRAQRGEQQDGKREGCESVHLRSCRSK
jgi:hypothetical protein